MRARIKTAKDIVTNAKATPAAQYAKAVGGSIASTEVENAVGSMLKTGTDGATRMRGLMQSAASDPAALDGLRKVVTDWIARTYMNADGTLSGVKLINFVKNNSDTLKELYPHDQVSMFGALARDAEEGMRWRTATSIKGGSDSAKNFLAALDKIEKGSGHYVTVGLMATEALGFGLEKMESIGWKAASLAGIGAATAYLANTLRQAGNKKLRTSTEAMAKPELARSLISKMPASADASALHNFARVLKRSLIVGPMSMQAVPSSASQH